MIAMKQRNGKVVIAAIPNTQKSTLLAAIKKHIAAGSTIVTDGLPAYKGISKTGIYKHEALNHSKKEYVRNGFHTNNVESVWAYVKQCWYGTHHWISSKHLWLYCAEWAFKYNTGANSKARNRIKNSQRFEAIMDMFSVQTTCKQIVDFVPDYAIAA